MSDKYTPTHASNEDGSTAMMWSESDGFITLINEDGYAWTDPSTQWRRLDETPLTPERVSARMDVLTGLRDVRAGLSTMLNFWMERDEPSDLLSGDEYPFHRSLEDMEAEVRHAIERIEERNEAALAAQGPTYKVPTMTVRELIDILSDYPGDTLLLGYADATDYVNVDGIGNTDFEGGPALVIELRQDYDPRQF